jgi:peptide/nickel transport system permease protein
LSTHVSATAARPPTAAAVELPRAPAHRTLRRFARHRLAVVGSLFLLVVVLLAAAAPVVSFNDPYRVDLRARGKPPSAEHILGTELAGRDVWARLVYGGQVSLSVGGVSIAVAGALGIVLGALAGFYRGLVDQVIMRLADVIMTLPTLVIILALVSFVGPSVYNVILVIGVLGWPGLARLVRAQFLSLRERDFVLAAWAVGADDWRVIRRHILPNAVGAIVVWASFGIAGAILTEAALSFLGFGVQPPTASWGNMLNAALSIQVIQLMPWVWIPPGLAVTLTVLSVNFVGDALRDALDARSTAVR